MKGLSGLNRLALAVLLAMTAGAQAEPRTDPPFTPQQRLEIVRILRDALRTDPSILRDAVQAAQQDDAARLDAATRAAVAAHRPALVADPADPIAGNPAGDVTLVEFYDTRCPYCRAALPAIETLLRADPNLRIVYKDLPVLGPNSVREAKGLIAAQNQGGYLRMQDAVMHAPAPLAEDALMAAAIRAGLDGSRFAHDMADPATAARIDANLKLAEALHVEGTPVFVVGGQVIPGAVPLAQLQQAVENARLH